ncbi:aminotransferase [Microbacterium oleivorans]|uniref:aminotransferase n=1 Tax=Microbacterium oleivorans TaxID=273677 RepID=UPI00203FA70B|nr:aminotransferase [Microbacterium oleivorans]MCM3695105.1 aminotransferase [Microbacterium oleivorans]
MTDVFDYFSQVELPTPTLSDEEVQRLFADVFGVEIDTHSLGSQQDQNFRVFERGATKPLGVLKLSNPVFSEAEIEMQDAAAATVGARRADVRVPRIVMGPRGRMSAWWESSQGRIHARVIENIEGRTLMGSSYLSPAVVEGLGALSGKVSAALADFTHPASGRVLQWDLRHAERVIDILLPDEPDERIRGIVQRAADAARAVLAPVKDALPIQAGHFDVTDDNVLRAPGATVPDAVIDFGDACASWRVGDIAVTVSSVLHHEGASPETSLPAIRAFDRLRPLIDDEITALWPLVILRGAVLVLSGRAQVRVDEANEYALVALDREFRILEQAISVPIEVLTAATRAALSRPQEPAREFGAPLVAPSARRVELDASTESPLNDGGAWLDATTLDRAARSALDEGADVVTVAAWRPRLTGTTDPLPSTADTIPTDLLVWFREPVPIASGDGVAVHVTDGSLTWSSGTETLTISGLSPDESAAVLPPLTRLSIRRSRPGAMPPPLRVSPGMAAAWRHVAGDPGVAVGVQSESSVDDDSLSRRHERLAEVQEHYYAIPPRIERGWREYLVDVDGRVYLDMVNNVASVGHAHPHVVAAAARQMHLLNTNSRFHYRAIADYAERITATLPAALDTVFFVNSGSEATDLAIRLAMAATGRRDIVAMRESYHGWTYASDAVSTSIADNPNALATRPEWVHTVDAANSYRGIHRGAEAAKYAPEAAALIDALAADGRPAAGIITETYFGNAGGVALPDGYLQEVYAAVRRHGGLAIADEVQVGYGRLGDWFWGFQQQGVEPDIVAVAKSIGGGHPLGAVVTRRDIADRYRTGGYFFSSTGGSPVSSVIGSAVLDVIEGEGLQENARIVGGHLKNRLQDLAHRHEIIGAVHGSGLYLGLEFVRDRVTLEPARAETAAICDRLLECGVIMQPTGDHQNVLKIKPPLVVTQASVDVFVDALEHVLSTGW